MDLLTSSNPRYMQTCPLVIRPSSISDKYTYVITENILKGVVRYLEDHGVRPEYQCDAYGPQRHIEDWMIKTGIARNPPIMNLMAGFHGRGFASPAQADPWKYVYEASILESMPKSAVLGVCAGGRNWLPFTLFAMMLGVDMVRVGMEDCVFVHPHRDEKLRSSAQAVEMVVEMARILGRDIATPDEAREILGVTSVKAPGRKAIPGLSPASA